MATAEHCLYCFETLAAKLENRKGLDLEEVQNSFTEYSAFLASDDAAEAKSNKPVKKLPALRRLVGNTSSSSSSSSSTSSLQSPESASGSSSSTSLSANTSATSVVGGGAAEPVTDPDAEYPLFVTWNKAAGGGEYHLRGCIGTFEAQPLAEGLSSYAVIAALHDSRFSRVSARELPSLQVAVTLLTDFEDAAEILDWELGTHGIRISFQWDGRRHGATYLPDVATEQGWTKEQTLVSLMRKAGWEGRRDRWREVADAGAMKVVRYRGDKEQLLYDEYRGWREWADEHWEL
ncbi:mmecr1 family protein [Diaporthe amygdali]|uniref:mmecr1 family protein n=1 Tax=Phomopsis amygdali TaxID=1214568 RepID=UPI0022FF34B2|nr:mmecr1 family protein [Diaporthe amygdali]KAJ0114409.1 mmecr1 family protein [Diaporthe amygdali]